MLAEQRPTVSKEYASNRVFLPDGIVASIDFKDVVATRSPLVIRRVYGYLLPRKVGKVSQACRTLESDGFAVLRGVFSKTDVAELYSDVERVFNDAPPQRSVEANNMFRYAMLNRSAVCQRAVANPTILDTIEPLLGEDCHVIANTAWRNPPNANGQHGGENWHIDAGPHVPLPRGVSWPSDIPHPVFAIGVHVYLQDCTMADGPTGVISGSHLSGRPPPVEQLKDDDLTFGDHGVTPLTAKAGDVGFFVSDVWHRRLAAQPGDQGRFFLQVHYGRRDIAQRLCTTAQVNHLSLDAIARAKTTREQTVVGLHRPLFYDG
jgi:ectoine hydroxylase-related dioxygenase (phytanoyl-CoA dioxygenase family)